MSQPTNTNELKDNYEDKINSIMNHTIYTYSEALDKLKEHNFDHIKVIKLYMGIAEKKAPENIKSLNQEIYKQIRKQMDISEYNKKNPLKLDHVVSNLKEEDEKQNK
jgi:hypothetical protein